MDRREAIEWLKCIRRTSIFEQVEALDLAIEALVLQDKHIKAVERMIEGAKEINKFLEEAAKKSDEKHQLSGETSIISEKHQLMLPLDDAVKVVGRICDEWWTLEDGDIEFIRNELEQKCYRIDQTTDCISRKQAINAVENTDIKITESEWDELISVINNLPPVTPINNIQKADTLIIATALRDFAQDSERKIPDRERAEELREQVLAYGASMCKPVTPTERKQIREVMTMNNDLISRQKAIETCDKMYPQVDRQDIKTVIEATPSVTPTERTGEWYISEYEFFTCDQCGEYVPNYAESTSEAKEMLDNGDFPKFCPNCGAMMTKGGDE